MVAASERKPGQNAASIAGEQSPGRQRQRREPGKPTWRCLNRLSLSSAWLAPLNRGSLNSAHIHGTDVPVEKPSTASKAEDRTRANIHDGPEQMLARGMLHDLPESQSRLILKSYPL
jgi:hypothetical protein